MNYKVLLNALGQIEDDRKISKEVVMNALKEALIKAYRKNVEIPDIALRVEINEDNGHINMFQQYTVVNEVEDDELEISFEDAKELKEGIALGEYIEKPVSLNNLSRASATLARNVMKQKIREAEKLAVYEEYADLLDEMVLGIVESVEEKFVLVNLGRTIAMMPSSARIPNERYTEGQKIRVIITEVKKETKGSQVVVSRTDAKLVKRLFEKEVPEIFQGIVEIKAIAREAGERTKMAVYSHNPDVDAIGACIGPKGTRVQEIIEELKGEKIDIFEWSDNVSDLVRNALAPAEVVAVIPSENSKGLIVVVNKDQLSLAIGKKGKNARLAVKLTEKKIDIKTKEDLDEQGVDYIALQNEYLRKIEEEKLIKQAKQLKEEVALEVAEEFEEEIIEEVIEEAIEENMLTEEISEVEEIKEDSTKPEVVKEENVSKKKKLLESKATEYVSVFEKLVGDTSKPKTEKPDYKNKKKKKEEDEHKPRLKDLKKDLDYEIKPLYSEEELEEIRRQEEEEELTQYDDYMDYEDYDEYYDDED